MEIGTHIVQQVLELGSGDKMVRAMAVSVTDTPASEDYKALELTPSEDGVFLGRGLSLNQDTDNRLLGVFQRIYIQTDRSRTSIGLALSEWFTLVATGDGGE